jgi:hypothetical protein
MMVWCTSGEERSLNRFEVGVENWIWFLYLVNFAPFLGDFHLRISGISLDTSSRDTGDREIDFFGNAVICFDSRQWCRWPLILD